MSATERDPFGVRQRHAREMDLALVGARSELVDLEAELAALERRIDAAVKGPPGAMLLTVLGGVLGLPLVALVLVIAFLAAAG
jgi:hypothetical protein